MEKIAIVGAGASGMLAGLLLKERGHDVTVFERNDKIMKKILATGNGRCNFTNRNVSFKNFHGENPKFSISALSQFTNEDTIDLFHRWGIPEVELEEGRIYPLNLQAATFPLRFLEHANFNRLNIQYHTFIKEVRKEKDFILTDDKGREYRFQKLILSTGGRAMERSGSDGSGYGLAKMLGHSIVKTHPGIVQLKLDYPYLKRMDGTKFPGSCTLYVEDKKIRQEFSDILFTKYGISGPAVLQISSFALRSLRKNKDVTLSIDILPMINENELDQFLYNLMFNNSFFTLEKGLMGLIHKNLILPILRDLNLDPKSHFAELSKEEVHDLKVKIKDYRFKVTGEKSDKDGQVTCGGVSTKEIQAKTMESKIQPGLYFTGELMDIDGDCGGYNLQWAWSSAYACADNLDKDLGENRC